MTKAERREQKKKVPKFRKHIKESDILKRNKKTKLDDKLFGS